MKTYIFTYFAFDSRGRFVPHQFFVSCTRFSHALAVFRKSFNLLDCDEKDFSLSYQVVVDGKSSYRTIPDKYISSFHRLVREV